MILDEPKIEFVPVNLNGVLTEAGSGCPDWQSQTPAGGGQRCIASQEEAVECEDWDTQYPWLD